MEPETILMLPVWYAVFLLSATCHEAAHAWVALLGGDRTAYLGGQVSLNPLPHLLREPFGTLVVPLISYFLYASAGNRWMLGWASAPYDPAWEERHPRRAALMALGGPLANLLLTLIALLVLRLGLENGVWTAPTPDEFASDHLVVAPVGTVWGGIGRFFSVLFTLNLVLAVLNLLPLPPLDGASILAGWVRPFRMLRAQFLTSPIAGMIGLLVAWQVFPKVFGPIYVAVLGWIYG